MLWFFFSERCWNFDSIDGIDSTVKGIKKGMLHFTPPNQPVEDLDTFVYIHATCIILMAEKQLTLPAFLSSMPAYTPPQFPPSKKWFMWEGSVGKEKDRLVVKHHAKINGKILARVFVGPPDLPNGVLGMDTYFIEPNVITKIDKRGHRKRIHGHFSPSLRTECDTKVVFR